MVVSFTRQANHPSEREKLCHRSTFQARFRDYALVQTNPIEITLWCMVRSSVSQPALQRISPGHRGLAFLVSALAWAWLVAADDSAVPRHLCRIDVVEKGTGWPVPLVELRTTHNVRFVSDNAGMIAFDLPELMGRETWFDVIGHGYDVPRDGFGSRGVRLRPQPGGTLRVEVTRRIIAKRLGRLTGAGLFAESQKLGRELDWRESGNLGCDSVQSAVHRARLFWAWGDTIIPNYPLGIFDMTSATSAVQPLGSFQPPLRLKFDYFTDAQG